MLVVFCHCICNLTLIIGPSRVCWFVLGSNANSKDCLILLHLHICWLSSEKLWYGWLNEIIYFHRSLIYWKMGCSWSPEKMFRHNYYHEGWGIVLPKEIILCFYMQSLEREKGVFGGGGDDRILLRLFLCSSCLVSYSVKLPFWGTWLENSWVWDHGSLWWEYLATLGLWHRLYMHLKVSL